MELMIMDVVEDTVVDGPGFRTAVYAAGCSHQCRGCHNPQSWDMNAGHAVEVGELAEMLLSDPFANITFSGGDPFEQVEAFTDLARRIKAGSGKTIWCYTGYRFEEIIHSPHLAQLLSYIDVLVDGRFDQDLCDTDLLFRGSSNQRLVDVAASLSAGKACMYDYFPFV